MTINSTTHKITETTKSLKEYNLKNIIQIMSVGSKALPVRGGDNLAAICVPTVLQCGIHNISQPYMPPLPVTGIALVFLLFYFVSI
jgi:hypothetical protein